MPFTRKLNMLLILAGLLAWYGCTFPSFDSGDEAARANCFPDKQFKPDLTATGIAPDLHRTSLLIPVNDTGNQHRGKNKGIPPKAGGYGLLLFEVCSLPF